jgi:hypothetical protein
VSNESIDDIRHKFRSYYVLITFVHLTKVVTWGTVSTALGTLVPESQLPDYVADSALRR